MNITDLCIRRPVLAWMLMAGLVLFGAVAWSRIGVSQFPDVDFPTITVDATWEGAAPDIVEGEIVDPIEEALIQVEGVTALRSNARRGSASITVELDIARDVDVALQEVQARVASVRRRLPADMDEPTFGKRNPEDQPIMWLGLSGPLAPQVLADYARYRVKERLQTVPGVGEITIGGSIDRNVRIWLRPTDLDRYALTADEVVARLRSNHVELPAGALKGGGREVAVRFIGEAFDLAALRALPVGGEASAPIRLDQVAAVEDGFADVTRVTRVAQLGPELPKGMLLGVNYDSTPFIAESVAQLRHEILLAIVLTALVCWGFLKSSSSTLNVLLAIPMSLLGSLAVIHALGWTLNTFTLLGLGLAVGIVVDDAILVLENIVRRRELGEDAPTAAARGTHEITFSALAATLAVIAIVVPVVFMSGIQGRYFLQFGVALCVAVAISYIEAVTLAPARCAQLLAAQHGERANIVGRAVDRLLEMLERMYARVLPFPLHRPWTTLVIALLFTAGGFYGALQLPRELVPAQDQGRLRVTITTAVGSQLEETDALVRQVEAKLIADPTVARVLASIGGGGPQASSANSAWFLLTLQPHGKRPPHTEVMTRLRKELNTIPGLTARIEDPSTQGFGGGGGRPIEFVVAGSDWDKLVETATRFRDRLAASGTAVDVDTPGYQIGSPELRVIPDRALAEDLGVPLESVARTIEVLLGGARIGKFSVDGRRVDMRAQLELAGRDDPADLLALRLRARDGTLIPLAAVASSEERPALQQITRRDRSRAITIVGNVAPRSSLDQALAEIERMRADLPEGVRLQLTGQSAQVGAGLGDIGVAMLLGIAVAYMVLAAQFNSFVHPFTVLSILPLSIGGGALALLASGKSLNLFSGIGFVLLMGLAKKNSIVLVDFAARRQAQGVDARTAMHEAAPQRLRPIMMTSIATIVAALPIALAIGAGGETRQPMALVIVGGMVLATTLSLLVVPAVYVLIDRLRRHAPPSPPPPPPLPPAA